MSAWKVSTVSGFRGCAHNTLLIFISHMIVLDICPDITVMVNFGIKIIKISYLSYLAHWAGNDALNWSYALLCYVSFFCAGKVLFSHDLTFNFW